ncbi:MAG: pilus assembly protein [Rhodospirillales bacterium]|nr:pilus assembly protein [Alphaproteobacteria bacterium]MCB1838702.1 pilus assembly protein [Alphaproteobacteria bacterium]MCB9977650.1 pilus assembly protein [Rhodospirillales bacterium]
MTQETIFHKAWGRVRTYCRRYAQDNRGTIAVAFGIMAPLLIGMVGMSLDYSQAYLVRSRLAQALDASALAAAAYSADEAEIEQRVQDFFDANYPEDKLGVTFDPIVQVVGDEVRVTGNATYNTMFLKVLGIDTIDVTASTIVVREIQGLEVALVLDNTGSMASYNNIDALKTGTENFINILFDNTSNPDNVRIGMIPFANTVNVGSYGLGYNPDGSTYASGEPFVTLPSGVSTTTNHGSSGGWYGCIVEHMDDGYDAAATHAPNSYGQLWRSGSNWDGHGWDPGVNSNDPYDWDVTDDYEGPWDIYSFGKVITYDQSCSGSGYSSARCSNCGGDGLCNSPYCFCRNSTPNQGCPYAQIMPLTSDRDALLDHVDTMTPDGNTLGNIGMAWGYRVLSPEFPFEEAHDWDNFYWKKAIVMMTDGDNTENGTYSSFWFTNKNNMSVTKFNNRFAEVCEALKDHGVAVYTITFTSGISESTKDYFRQCATSEDQYYDAPTQEELIDVFERIARELSNLHIKG